jgi:hypothetical protein
VCRRRWNGLGGARYTPPPPKMLCGPPCVGVKRIGRRVFKAIKERADTLRRWAFRMEPEFGPAIAKVQSVQNQLQMRHQVLMERASTCKQQATMYVAEFRRTKNPVMESSARVSLRNKTMHERNAHTIQSRMTVLQQHLNSLEEASMQGGCAGSCLGLEGVTLRFR